MSEADGLTGLDLTQRVVLLGVVELSASGDAPAHAGQVRRVCVETLDAVEADVVGTLTEAEVTGTLNELEAGGHLDGSRDDTSPTGKGRPSFRPAVDRDEAVAAFTEDDRLGPVLSRVESAE